MAQGRAFALRSLQDSSDAEILNFALGLEHLEAAFYTEVVAGGALTERSEAILTSIRDNEVAHVAALTEAVRAAGGVPVAAQESYNFGDVRTEAAILATAETLEGVGVGAYTGAAALVSDKKVLSAAAGIEQVEARHHGVIRFLNAKNPSETALGPVLTAGEVEQKVAPILGG